MSFRRCGLLSIVALTLSCGSESPASAALRSRRTNRLCHRPHERHIRHLARRRRRHGPHAAHADRIGISSARAISRRNASGVFARRLHGGTNDRLGPGAVDRFPVPSAPRKSGWRGSPVGYACESSRSGSFAHAGPTSIERRFRW